LHGIASRGVSWWPVLAPLAQEFRVIVLDLRGHGDSAKPDRGYLLPDFADDLSAALAGLAIDRPRLLGHSLGALVILEWAIAAPDRAAAIALEDPPLRVRPDLLDAFDGWRQLAALPVPRVAAYYQEEHPEWSAEECWRRAESITATDPAVFAELRTDAAARLEAGTVERFRDLATIRSPTLLLYGDPAVGGMLEHEDALRFQEQTVAGSLRRVAGGGHALHREHAATFVDAVIPFLRAAG